MQSSMRTSTGYKREDASLKNRSAPAPWMTMSPKLIASYPGGRVTSRRGWAETELTLPNADECVTGDFTI